MCGRYGRRGDKQRIAEWMQSHDTGVFDGIDDLSLAPSFNVAPQSFQPVVKLDRETGKPKLAVMRWGLVPYWTLLANSIGPGIGVTDLRTAVSGRPLVPNQIQAKWQNVAGLESFTLREINECVEVHGSE